MKCRKVSVTASEEEEGPHRGLVVWERMTASWSFRDKWGGLVRFPGFLAN